MEVVEGENQFPKNYPPQVGCVDTHPPIITNNLLSKYEAEHGDIHLSPQPLGVRQKGPGFKVSLG